MYEPVSPARIRAFLEALGREYRHPARILLVGGTTIVLKELRAHTVEIDLVVQVSNEHRTDLVEAIRRLKVSMDVSVEEVNPGDFIPLPRGHDTRTIFFGRFGEIEVLHFDPYSTALSKVARWTDKDIEDVLAMARSGLIEKRKLDECYRDILPRFGKESLKQDPASFKQHYADLKQKLPLTDGMEG